MICNENPLNWKEVRLTLFTVEEIDELLANDELMNETTTPDYPAREILLALREEVMEKQGGAPNA